MSEIKYKKGDKVRIKSLDWYHHNKDGFGSVYIGDKKPKFTYAMSKYCGQVLTVDGHFEYEGEYYMIEDDGVFTWTDEMFEGVVEDGVNGEYYLTPIYFVRPNGYQFVDENGNVINATKIVLEKKKNKYPKTYEECCKVLGIDEYDLVQDYRIGKIRNIQSERIEKLNDLNQILICRDAYWKIAGEEMGLGKPWKPIDNSEVCYGIFTWAGEIQHDTTAKWCILTFPTPEMRDAFYENFKKEIEICKEFL